VRVEVDCGRVRHNVGAIVQFCAACGIQVAGVTKACCGHPEVARAMLAGGVRLLADSRLGNVRRLRQAGLDGPVMLLRLPALSEVEDVVALTQISLNSQVETVRALSHAARAQGVSHQVVLMVDVGDRREGVMPDRAHATARDMLALPGIELVGIGTNLRCIGGVLPTQENTQLLVDVAEEIERSLGLRFDVVSGGQTTSLMLLQSGEMPPRVNQLRIGEGMLLGYDSASNWSLPGMHRDAFTVIGEVIEVITKPSLPAGTIALDAFGRAPHWEDRGLRRRAILSMGNQDLRTDGLRCRRSGATVVGASSDHLIVDVTDASPPVRLGEELEFTPDYAALASVMASRQVTQVVRPV
jgi:predicted amino acid racemase